MTFPKPSASRTRKPLKGSINYVMFYLEGARMRRSSTVKPVRATRKQWEQNKELFNGQG